MLSTRFRAFAKRVVRLFSDRSGVAIVEFALILPLMVLVYVGASEISRLLSVDRKVVLLTRTLADVTSQYSTLASSDIVSIMQASAAVMSPYDWTAAKATLTGMSFPSATTVSVDWTAVMNSATARSCAAGAISVVSNSTAAALTNVPTGIVSAGSYIIVADVTYTYAPLFLRSLLPNGGITLTETFFMRPRNSSTIPYTSGTTTVSGTPTVTITDCP